MQHDLTDVVSLLDEASGLLKSSKGLEEQALKLARDALSIKAKAQKLCTHPATKKDSQYHRGGYDYVSSVTITHTCVICGKVLKSYDDPNHKGYHA